MYIREIVIRNLKLMRDFRLAFSRADGSARPWTVIVGRNGTGKSSLLYAIGLAAAGQSQANALARPILAHLRDRRTPHALEVVATFSFPPHALRDRSLFPELPDSVTPSDALRLRSTVRLPKDESTLEITSAYTRDGEPTGATRDPLERARSRNLPHWFVAGYGVSRILPDPLYHPPLVQWSAERLAPLFDARSQITSLAFTDHFADQPEKLSAYSALLNRVLIGAGLLPDLEAFRDSPGGSARRPGELLDREQFTQRLGGMAVPIPAVALAHGYQSTIAWIADLLGHILLESGEAPVEPQDMRGLVLVDEIDLHLHPNWQVSIVQTLRRTFPYLQFVVTTHSPLVLASVAPDEVVLLERDGDDNVRCADWTGTASADARLMTTADLYRRFFELDDIFPNPLGRRLREFVMLARDPYRSETEEARLRQLATALSENGVEPDYPIVPRQ